MDKAVAFRTIMNGPYRDHPSEDALERFLLHQSEEDELEIVETHFMACEACVTRLETLDFNIQAAKLACEEIVRAEQAAQTARPTAKNRFFSWLTIPRISFTAASLAACALALTFVSVPRDFNFTANRGIETNYVPRWLPLRLHLNAQDLPAAPVSIEVVDAQGNRIWQGKAATKSDRIDVTVPRLMAAGHYFVRVYSAQEDARAELLREYSVETKPLF